MLEMIAHVTSQLRRLGKQRLALIGGGVLAGAFVVALFGTRFWPAPYDLHWRKTSICACSRRRRAIGWGRTTLAATFSAASCTAPASRCGLGWSPIALAASTGTLLGARGWRVSRRGRRHAHHAADGPDVGVPQHPLGHCHRRRHRAGHRQCHSQPSASCWCRQFARLMRSSVLTVREATYVEAARALGASESRLLFYSILPNCTVPLVVQATLSSGTAILDAAGLSFLGLGAPAADPRVGSHAIRGTRVALASALGHGLSRAGHLRGRLGAQPLWRRA